MKTLLLLLVALIAVEQSNAHLCLLSPHQRGSEQGLNVKGSDDCKLVQGPCGNRTANPKGPIFTYKAGESAPIIFQKNLDHFNSASPGKFTIMIGNMESDMKLLMTVPDTNTPSGYLYTQTVTMPDMEMEKGVLQVVYDTNNPEAPPAFYQCADVSIMKM